MREKIIKLYKFDELDPDVQEKVIDKHRTMLVDDSWWYESTIDFHTDELQNMGFNKVSIYFSGFWSQGDGAVFECKSIDFDTILEKFVKENFLDIYTWYMDGRIEFGFSIHRGSSYYSHERTARFEVDYLEVITDDELTQKEYDDLKELYQKRIDEFENWMEDWRLDYCHKIYKELENDYEYQTSDDAIKESLIINEYEFLEDGTWY